MCASTSFLFITLFPSCHVLQAILRTSPSLTLGLPIPLVPQQYPHPPLTGQEAAPQTLGSEEGDEGELQRRSPYPTPLSTQCLLTDLSLSPSGCCRATSSEGSRRRHCGSCPACSHCESLGGPPPWMGGAQPRLCLSFPASAAHSLVEMVLLAPVS